jgi:hypothetical protein
VQAGVIEVFLMALHQPMQVALAQVLRATVFEQPAAK